MDHLIGVVCEAFNCTPDVAEKQDMRKVARILEARLLDSAKAQHNEDASKMTEAQTALWIEAMGYLND